MPPTEIDLSRLRSEMLDYIGQKSLPVFHASGVPGGEEYTYWDSQAFPDWRQFIDVAKESGAKLIVFTVQQFEESDVDLAIERLEECDLTPDERREYGQQFESLRKYAGQTAFVRAAFAHADHWLACEFVAPWHDEFEEAMDDLATLLPFDLDEDEDDEDPDFFSRN